MTPAQHKKEASRLRGAVTRARTKVVGSHASLAAKLELLRDVHEAEIALMQHRLNYFELTADCV